MSISQPPSCSSSRAPSLFAVEIPNDVIDEIEEQRDRERILWRRDCRLAHDRREAAEREARAREEESYPVVKATVGAVGDGSSWRGRREVSFNFNLALNSIISVLQSESSVDEGDMVCLTDFLDRKEAMESGWGGPGEVKALLDDGVAPGPGEEEHERQTEEIFRRRILLLEETVVRRGREGNNKERDGRGGWGQERDGYGGW